MAIDLLKKGDKVVMHTCIEAEKYNGKIWTCEGDEFTKGKGVYAENVVFLEGFSGYFCTEYLQKINLSSEDNKENLRVSELGNKQLYEEIKILVKEKVKLIDSLIGVKKQYEMDFTEEELSELEPRDECIYKTVSEILKEIDVEG